jgi:hypothetical protein
MANAAADTATATTIELACVPNASAQQQPHPHLGFAQVPNAMFLVSLLDRPDKYGAPDAMARNLGVVFPRFMAAFETAAAAADHHHHDTALPRMSQAQRLALKAVLHEDFTSILAAAERQATAAKTFNGRPLPACPTQCLGRVDALLGDAERQVEALQARVVGLKAARNTLVEMQLDVQAAALLQQHGHAFTRMPGLTDTEIAAIILQQPSGSADVHDASSSSCSKKKCPPPCKKKAKRS